MEQQPLTVFIVTVDYPASSSDVCEKLNAALARHHFSTTVADRHGIVRSLPANTFAVASFMDSAALDTLMKTITSAISASQPDVHIVTRDDYFSQRV